MFNIYLGIFIVVGLATIAGGTFTLFKMGQSVGAFLFFIGALVVFILYGLRWFGAKNSLFSETPVSWPPTINTCPDFLIYYERSMPDGSKQDSCIDTIGVSKNGSIKVFPASGGAPPTSEDYYFSLVTKSSDNTKKNQELCQRAITAGLTWEGITNGESCITPSGPVAPSGGGGSGSCPGN